MDYHFRNLVFEGGGVKGLAYCGALEYLDSKGILAGIQRVGGASAGALVAVLIGLNYSAKDLRVILHEMNLKDFTDDSWGLLRDAYRLFKHYGLYKGDKLKEWISGFIQEKTGDPNATFRTVQEQKAVNGFKDIYIVGTNLSTRLNERFSYTHTPDMRIADAVRISMSIPLFFSSVRNEKGDVYVDGGLLDNYPVKMFDDLAYMDGNTGLAEQGHGSYRYNNETLGFRLDSSAEIRFLKEKKDPVNYHIRSFPQYLQALLLTLLQFQTNQHLNSADWDRTIYIDTLEVESTDFHLNDQTKERLVRSGHTGARRYFDWYDHPESAPANRP